MAGMKPLLAHTIEDTSKIKFPVYASVKLDGIRCLIINGVAMSRSLKPIRNKFVQQCLGKPEYEGLDGELIVGDMFAPDCYRTTNSGVMSEDGEPDFTFYVFDRIDMPEAGFRERFETLRFMPYVKVVPHLLVENHSQLLDIEQSLLARGAEGVMVRDPNGYYKNGRSTVKDGILGKIKKFTDAEYEVIGYEERLHNSNPATINELGYIERSSHQENKVGRGDLGALILKYEGGTFNCGSGFDDATRKEIWDNRDKYLGQMAKVKYFPVGIKAAPRFPTFIGFRSKEDL